ncbi:MAG: TonB-dependent receptor [Thiomicrospira sp.]|uniref:TonB-dependent receptor n=1 Tax=Thiomicrospira sp. TaxID=935 RepID=UPI0019EF0DED|nr:TonB-dependent receptor [Thiomicrospira sp.]MBE0493518.1 TonB-dependent receptor [Thiomicrospira sp.]
MKHTSLRLAVLAALGVSAPILAADLSAIVISASPIHSHEVFEVPTQVDSLSGDEKSERDSASLGELLEAFPGVNNQSTGGAVGKPVIRGLTGERTKVLSNGNTLDYQAYGERHGPTLDPYLYDRVEVIRGAQGVLYGSEAMGGVVSLHSPEIPYAPPGETHQEGELATEFQPNNQAWMAGAKAGIASDKLGLTFGLVQRSADNFRSANSSAADEPAPGDNPSSKPLVTGETPYTNYENQAVNIGLGYQADWGNVEARYSQWQGKQNFLLVHEEATGYDLEGSGQQMQHDEFQLKAEVALNQAWLFKPSWTRSYNTREESHDEPFETMAEHKGTDHYLDLRVKRDDVKLGLVHPKVGAFEGEVGIELMDKTQTLKSGHLAPSAKETRHAVYLFEEADYDRWLVQWGARYDVHKIKAGMGLDNEHFWDDMAIYADSSNERQFSVLTGALGATYRFNERWKLAANLGQGFRAPSVFELFAGGTHSGVDAFQRGNPDLKAETSLNTDLSLRWQAEQSAMNMTAYQNSIDNYIYLERTGFEVDAEGDRLADCNTVTCYDEMQAEQTNAVMQGLEWQLSHQFNQAWSVDTALELIAGRDTSNKRDLPLLPANNLRLNVHYVLAPVGQLQNQRLSVGFKAVADRKTAGEFEAFSQYDDMPFGTASTEAYQLWNMGYHAQIKIDKNQLDLGLKVDNLFDTAYRDFLDTYKGYAQGMGRNIKLSARLAF